MRSKVLVFIDDKGKPANIPDYATFIKQCFKLGPAQATATNVSGVRITLEKSSDHDVSDIWVKYGDNINMGEARTQHFVAQYLQHKNSPAVRAPRLYLAFTWDHCGFIVSEYIYGQECDDSDDALITTAVSALITIPSPDLKPGPVGGGLIEHPFFYNRTSSVEYKSIEDLEDHGNGILSVTGRKSRVNFREEVTKHGLCLCVSDLKLVNFLKNMDGRIVAVDFGGYSFLPPSFFAFALKQGCLAHRIATMLNYPSSSPNASAVESASYALAPFSSNDIGVPERLWPKRRY